jgi:hypothetical protein
MKCKETLGYGNVKRGVEATVMHSIVPIGAAYATVPGIGHRAAFVMRDMWVRVPPVALLRKLVELGRKRRFSMRFVLGCAPVTELPETSTEKEQRLDDFGLLNLPSDAKKVMDLGNDWYTFELESYGHNRVFLFHRVGDYRGECSWGLECITELDTRLTGPLQ